MMVFGSYLHIFFFKFKYLVKFLIKSDFDRFYLKEKKSFKTKSTFTYFVIFVSKKKYLL